LVLVTLALLVTAGVTFALWRQSGPSSASNVEDRYVARPAGTVTFNRDIAPIFYKECATCHRPGQAGPFDLITYTDAKKRAGQIGEVTQSRFMPPWLPEHGIQPLADERRLNAEQVGLIQQWVADGAPEGDTADLPAVPLWTDGWQLGPPDLVVTMPETYTLPADGKDIYRNFVIPVASSKDRHVRALEFRADTKAIHHAFLRLDRSYQCRKMDAQDKEPGFGGMETPIGAEDMGGHFMSWQPGRGPTRIPEGLAFTLPAGADLVLQFHMQPTGKPEPIRPSIGFYFTDQAATNKPMKLSLSSFAIDIPANSSNFAIEDSYLLPVDVDLLAVLPHTHYLGKRLEGYAILPDGARQDLLLIKDWDFNWQSDYRFVHPVALPKGTRLAMRYIFDNTTNNVRNPNHPPIRVKYGLQSTDEMGELWFQVLTRNKNDFVKLEDDLTRRGLDDVITFNTIMLRQNPNNPRAHNQIAKALLYQRKPVEAIAHLQTAVRLQPDNDEAHYHLGIVAMDHQNYAAAEAEFEAAARANPDNFKARNNLGLVCLRQNRLDEAEAHFNEVLRLNPGDAIAEGNLRAVARAKSAKR
jgi:hypothetical protein